ncbi:hypothetical protein EDD86DRAFT_130706 [Gorgonomyces haynaldii]|nr:hypothetical protein EDD86DRAFT_130706 [Gorgonomyces haynaldii]
MSKLRIPNLRQARVDKIVEKAPKHLNMVLPSFETELQPDNSIEKKTGAALGFARLTSLLFDAAKTLFGLDKPPLKTKLFSPFGVKKIAVIGVHGWFPGSFLRRVVGEPVGTSFKFAKMMADATFSYFLKRYGITLPESCLSLIPLEGEGKILHRVDLLYNQVVDPFRSYLRDLEEADVILVAAHSQGTPVSIMLMQKLIEMRHVDPKRQKIGILTMAGISHGPFPDLKSSVIVKYVETDPARELFDFCDGNSKIATQYSKALTEILDLGVRVVAVGSWYDQVVPLYSATLQGFVHPGIYRALYIDAVDYQPDFLSHLIVFALSLRNYGLDDFGLAIHLSPFLEGNIYGFGTQGHYNLYEELNTYILGVAWILSNKSLHDTDLPQPTTSFTAPQKINPYILPWIMARLSESTVIAEHPKFGPEFAHLIKLFAEWDASNNKAARDLKYRLEPLKSRL